MPESDLVKTGIKGLDEVLFGGIPRGNIILVAGSAGTGKTTLGVEVVYRGGRQFNEPKGGEPREAFHLLAEGLHRENLTAMLALESTMGPAPTRAPEEFVADTILQLTIEPVQRAVLRSVEVVKSRGHEYALGRHSFRIVNGQGLEVYRRVQAPRSLQREGSAAFDTTSRVATGIPGLDELVNGG